MEGDRKMKYPPHTEDLEKLAEFFDHVDSTELAELEEMAEVPVRDFVNVSIRLPRSDVELLRRVAAQEGLAPSAFMRWVLRRFVRGLTVRQ